MSPSSFEGPGLQACEATPVLWRPIDLVEPLTWRFQETGTVASVAKGGTDRYPVVVRFEKVNYAGVRAPLALFSSMPLCIPLSLSLSISLL